MKNRPINKTDVAEPGDEIGPWPRQQLIEMDERFRRAMVQALERPPADPINRR